MNAKGFAIFSVIKAGFVLSTQVGSGVVTAKFDDESMGNTSGGRSSIFGTLTIVSEETRALSTSQMGH